MLHSSETKEFTVYLKLIWGC